LFSKESVDELDFISTVFNKSCQKSYDIFSL